MPVFLQNELSGFPLVWVDEGDGGKLKAEPERKKKRSLVIREHKLEPH